MKIQFIQNGIKAFMGLSKALRIGIIISTVTLVSAGGYFTTTAIINANSNTGSTEKKEETFDTSVGAGFRN
ncbi:hypothetical protein JW962_03035 [Candidatus Dojkabacteria bacterium]|nr:hypothetical protein [Candidatus Dojkabacteria bacterium]